MNDLKGKKITVVRRAGIPKEAIMPTGEKIYRAEDDMVFIPQYRGKIRSAEYDNHFCYYWANAPKRYPMLLCTCGSIAGVVGYDVYKNDATPSPTGVIPGAMLICHSHASTGKHSDGSE